MKAVAVKTRMPLPKPIPCSQNPNDPGHHCWHGVARGAVDKDKLRCCHCDAPTTHTQLFNPARKHGPFAPMRPVRAEA